MENDAAAERKPGQEASANGTGWDDKPDSAEVILALAERIGDQQRRIAASANSGLQAQVDRGQHQKQHLGARGTLRIFEEIPEVLKKGPLATPFAAAVACRFSSGQPCPFADQNADVRGVALKFFTPSGVETDLLMTNEGGRSHARTATQFMDFADVLVARIEQGAVGALQTLTSELRDSRLGPLEVASIVGILTKETVLHSVDSLATERYWGSVVALDDVAIKYSLHPHDTTPPGTDADAHADDYLRLDLQNRLQKGPIKWQLCVQTFVNEKETPINDASIAWAGAPIPVGELEISSAPSAADELLIKQMAFNPGNGFAPLGITHARVVIYAHSAKNRAARGVLSSDEARRFLA
jgi:hypothetical protein